jgi:cytochrome c oxidase subunit 4
VSNKRSAFRLGVYVFLALAVLTGLEFWVSASFNSAVILLVIALVKAALIVQYFMHVARLWQEESEIHGEGHQ